jgi:hypothetical protein
MSGKDGHSTEAPLARRPAASSGEPDRGPGFGPASPAEPISFTLDDAPIDALPGETILQAAERHGTRIPHLCYTRACARTGTAARAWSRSPASACSRRAAAAADTRA